MTKGPSPTVGQARGSAQGLLVCPRFPYPPSSGGVKRALRMAEAMLRAGLEVEILTDDQPDAPSLAAVEAAGITTFVSPPPRRSVRRRIEQHVRLLPAPPSHALAKRLSDHGLASRVMVQLEGVIAASHLPVGHAPPIVFSTHNVEADLAQQGTARAGDAPERLQLRYHAIRVARCERRTAQRAAVVLCVSDADAAVFERHSRHVVVAPNGVDPEFYSVEPTPPESARESVLFFGQFTYAPNREGITRFLRDGWPTLAKSRPRCRLHIAGEGSDTLPLPTEHPDRIDRLGLVDDIANEVARSALTIVPIWSGGGTRLKVLESLAAMRPVVGTRLGVSGIGFEDGGHGLIAENASEMARGAAALLATPERLRWMGEQGRNLAEAFAWERALAPTERIYAQLAVDGELRVSRNSPRRGQNHPPE